jgi:hypothetical protein
MNKNARIAIPVMLWITNWARAHRAVAEHADTPNRLGDLGVCRDWPRSSGTTKRCA